MRRAEFAALQAVVDLIVGIFFRVLGRCTYFCLPEGNLKFESFELLVYPVSHVFLEFREIRAEGFFV